MPTNLVTPNLFQLSGHHLHITYATSGIDGKPHFTYQDAHQTLSFSGNDIRAVESDVGVLVSVSIRRTVDTGSTSFSVLIPRVNIPGEQSVPIHSQGITTLHKLSPIPAFNQGQLDTYSVAALSGSAQHVLF